MVTIGVAGGAGAEATFAGTGSETAAFGCTSLIVMSSVGKPSCFSTMCFGNWMSPNCA